MAQTPQQRERENEHVCAPSRTCLCYLLALEPAEDCPFHGWSDGRCDDGRYTKRAILAAERAKGRKETK